MDCILNYKQVEILKKFRERLNKEKFLNHQSSIYYSKQNNKFSIPGILITGIASIASFLSTSDIFVDNVKRGSAIGVGILTAGATILQSVSTAFGFKARADAFQKSADDYDDLLTKIEFEIVNPNEDFNEFCNELEANILKIKGDNKYFPPLFIHDLWDKYKHKLNTDDNTSFNIIVDKFNTHNTTSDNTDNTDSRYLQHNTDNYTNLVNIENNTNNNQIINDLLNINNETNNSHTNTVSADTTPNEFTTHTTIEFINGNTSPNKLVSCNDITI
jgi:hypothetical protein